MSSALEGKEEKKGGIAIRVDLPFSVDHEGVGWTGS